MKNFLTSMLGALAGIWITVIIFVIAAVVFVGILLFGLVSGKADVPAGSILHVDLTGKVVERRTPTDVKRSLAGYSEEVVSLGELTAAIEAAADDDRIEGIFLDCNGASVGAAAVREIVSAIDRFKESGKWVYAYADGYTLGNYVIATSADSLMLNPEGMVDIHGLSATTLFYKGLMDKAGIEVQVVKVGSYKSAVEPFTRYDMSDESREQQQVYLDRIWQSLCRVIADNRNVTPGQVDAWADCQTYTLDQQEYLDRKIVDGLRYRHQVEESLSRLTGKDDEKEPSLVSVEDYCRAVQPAKKSSDGSIALLYAVGKIVDQGTGGIDGSAYASLIMDLAKDKDIKGLVLRVNSGGGSAYASEQIWEALERFKETGKPFYVSMSDVAASGGYYISCGADRIYAQEQTLTGSIGIFGIFTSIKPLMNDKLGLSLEKVSTNSSGGLPELTEPLNPAQLASLQEYIERGYELFVSRCAESRGMSKSSIKDVAQGRVWDGGMALSLGLVDTIADLSTALSDMAELLELPEHSIREYPQINESLLQQLLSSEEISAGLPGSLKELGKCLETVEFIRTISPAQCRMEEVEIR